MRTESYPHVRIAATFTVDLIGAPLQRASELAGIPLRVSFAAYQQVFQELLIEESAFHRNTDGINVILFRPDDLRRESPEQSTNGAEIFAELKAALTEFAAKSRCALIFGFCPSPVQETDRASTTLLKDLQAISGVHVLDLGPLRAEFSNAEIFDSHGNEVASIPYQPAFMESLGFILARKVYSLLNPPIKVIVTDADETLWRGRIGEDGIHSLELTAGHRALQTFLQAQREEGVLLALCSKNEERDVHAAFDQHPEWPLKLSNFTAARVNWDEKAANLVSLSNELNLATSSFVFIDDDPIECAKIRMAHPEIAVLELPRDPADFESFLNAIWLFDRASITSEDSERAESYRRERERTETRRTAPSFQAFVEGLELEVAFQPLEAASLSRSSQLTLRTTQFNLNSVPRTEFKLAGLMADPTTIIETVSAGDRFGDYGIVGLLCCRPVNSTMVTETLLLSCRALGRGIEHRMLRRILEHARAGGCASAELRYVPTDRSRPMRDFLKTFGVEQASHHFTFSSTAPIPLTSVINSVDSDTPPQNSAKATVRADWSSLGLTFASRQSRSAALKPVIERRDRTTADLRESFAPPHSTMERFVADLWLMQIPIDRVGAQDNFFDLGGASLHLVEIHRHFHDRGFTHVTIADLFRFPTVAKLAAHLSTSSPPQTAIDRAKIRGSSQRNRLSKFRK